MQMYQSTPDYYRDYIEHGWLKDAASKAHKYIDRWRGKNGKWYYRYKSKAQEAGAKVRRKIKGYDDESTSVDIRKNPRLMSNNSSSYMNSQSRKAYVKNLSGKASSYSGQHGSNRNHKVGTSTRERGYSSSLGSNTSSHFGDYHLNMNWRRDTDAQNWADVVSGRKTYDQYHDHDGHKKAKNKKDVAAGIRAGRQRVAAKKKKK